jgi:hypothetical protein
LNSRCGVDFRRRCRRGRGRGRERATCAFTQQRVDRAARARYFARCCVRW